jgi:anti-sigma regulatory factor (Ser/Thr protein kinase)
MHAMNPARQTDGADVTGDYATSGLRHEVAVYGAAAQCADTVLGFLRLGLEAGEPSLVAVSPTVAELVRPAVRGNGSLVEFAVIAEFGRNPGRMIGTLWDFLSRSDGHQVQCVQEPLWADRSAAEVTEVLRHEALVNLAFAGAPVSLLCLYERRLLTSSGLADTELTHPALRTAAGVLASGTYLGAGVLPAACDLPLEPPSAETTALIYEHDLREVRRKVEAEAAAAGAPAERTADLVLAVSEVAANTLRHAGGRGELLTWHTADEVICEVRDRGTLTDPLVGRRRPVQLGPGHGLWVVNQVCDLVELRARPAQTTVRMHVRTS